MGMTEQGKPRRRGDREIVGGRSMVPEAEALTRGDSPGTTFTDRFIGKPIGQILSALKDRFGAYQGPGVPPDEVAIQHPSEEEAPRVRVYNSQQNTTFGPRTEEQATAFTLLRALSVNYDIAAICHQVLAQELAGLDWEVVPVKFTDRLEKERLSENCKRVSEMLKRPDRDLYLDAWAGMLLKEDLQIGAPVVYKHKTLGEQLGALEIIAGDTIKPVIDYRGRTVAYQQFFKGLPLGIWGMDEVEYFPRLRVRTSAYGIAPIELVMLNVNIALRRQSFHLRYYTDGNIPDALAGTPDEWSPSDVETYQEYFDAMLQGQDSERRKIRAWPGDVRNIYEFKKKDETTEFDEYCMIVTAAIHNLAPEEIGFTHRANKATSQVSSEAQQRKGVLPVALWMEGFFTDIIQTDLAEPELRFRYRLNKTESDRYAEARTDQIYIETGVYGPDYARDFRGIHLSPDDPLLTMQAVQHDAQMQQLQMVASGQLPQPGGPPGAGGGGSNGKGPGGAARPGAARGYSKLDVNLDNKRTSDFDRKQSDRIKNRAVSSSLTGPLRKWRDKSLGRLKKGQYAMCDFEDEALPETVRHFVQSSLAHAQYPDHVRAVFGNAQEMLEDMED